MCPAAASNLSRECKHLLRLAKRRGKAKEKANVDDDDDDQGCRFATALSLEGGRRVYLSISTARVIMSIAKFWFFVY